MPGHVGVPGVVEDLNTLDSGHRPQVFAHGLDRAAFQHRDGDVLPVPDENADHLAGIFEQGRVQCHGKDGGKSNHRDHNDHHDRLSPGLKCGLHTEHQRQRPACLSQGQMIGVE